MGSGDHFSPKPTLSTTQSSTPSATPSTRLLWKRNCHAWLARVKKFTLTTVPLTLPRVTSQRKAKVPRFRYLFYFIFSISLLYALVSIIFHHDFFLAAKNDI